MSWTGVFIAIEVMKELLTITGLTVFTYVCIDHVFRSRKDSKEIELIAKRIGILMNIPLEQAREILRGKKSD